MKVVLATNNKGKIWQLKEILSDLTKYGVELVTLEDINYTDDIEETGETFEQNSLIKSKKVCLDTGYAAIGEDSGLCVDALDGRPGVYTARYGGTNITKEEKLNMLLEELKDVPEDLRGASFVSVLSAYFPDGTHFTTMGQCKGKITDRIINLEGGMAFTPVFRLNGETRALSEYSKEELIQVNHRGRAAKPFIEKFVQYLNQK